MHILITTPSLKVPHGGTRVLNEWAAGLSHWHQVTLLVNSGDTHCNWYHLPQKVRVTKDRADIQKADVIIVGSPHSIYLVRHLRAGQKCFLFLQMLEHMFHADNLKFYQKCLDFYFSHYPMICISRWNIQWLRDNGRTAPTHYIGNGINLYDFPICEQPKDNRTVLVEGWEYANNTKDVDALGPKVAQRLRAEGYKILAYSQFELSRYADVPHEYYRQPSLEQLNDLYSRATVLIKATKYDARSTAPIEAMTKGTVTARAIIKGDDDLKHMENCIRVGYNEQDLYVAAKTLLTTPICKDLSIACIDYVKQNTWAHHLPGIIKIIS